MGNGKVGNATVIGERHHGTDILRAVRGLAQPADKPRRHERVGVQQQHVAVGNRCQRTIDRTDKAEIDVVDEQFDERQAGQRLQVLGDRPVWARIIDDDDAEIAAAARVGKQTVKAGFGCGEIVIDGHDDGGENRVAWGRKRRLRSRRIGHRKIRRNPPGHEGVSIDG